jgi:hypothetical protein
VEALPSVYVTFVFLTLALFLPVDLTPQVNTASLSGQVTDQSNAVVAHVHISVSNAATSYKRESETDASGYYSFQGLPIGEHKIEVSQQGFDSIQEQVQLGTAEKVGRDFVLKVGTTQTNVEVKADPANLSPDDASLGTIVDNLTIEETPLYLRNWDDLLRMVAGGKSPATPSKAEPQVPAASAISTFMGCIRHKTTFFWTALTTTHSLKTCRS